MSELNRLRDNVERWLIHKNYSFHEVKNPEDNFRFLIKHVGSFRIPLEIFEPKKQLGVIVLGGKFALKDKQMARYLQLNETEQENFKNSVKDFCDSIRAIHKITKEDGKLLIGVYLVLDNIQRFTQEIILDALQRVTEMGEKTMQFVMKTF